MYFLATIVATVCFWITIVFCVFKSIFIRRKPSQIFSVFKVRKMTTYVGFVNFVSTFFVYIFVY